MAAATPGRMSVTAALERLEWWPGAFSAAGAGRLDEVFQRDHPGQGVGKGFGDSR